MNQQRETEALPVQVSTAIEVLTKLADAVASARNYWPTVRVIRIAGDGDKGYGYALHAFSWEQIYFVLNHCWSGRQQRRRVFGYYGLPPDESDAGEWNNVSGWIDSVGEPIVRALEDLEILSKQTPTNDQLPPIGFTYWSGRLMEWIFSQAATSPPGSLLRVRAAADINGRRIPQGAEVCELSVKLFKAIELALRMELDAINGAIEHVKLSKQDHEPRWPIVVKSALVSEEETVFDDGPHKLRPSARPSELDSRNRHMRWDYVQGIPIKTIRAKYAKGKLSSEQAVIRAVKSYAMRHDLRDPVEQRADAVALKNQNGR